MPVPRSSAARGEAPAEAVVISNQFKSTVPLDDRVHDELLPYAHHNVNRKGYTVRDNLAGMSSDARFLEPVTLRRTGLRSSEKAPVRIRALSAV
jgi:hypothetical protein